MSSTKGRGFFGIGIWGPSYETNVGGLFRSAQAFGAHFMFTIGRKYKKQSTDTSCSTKHIPCYNFVSSEDFVKFLPSGCRIVCVELSPTARMLPTFYHPESAVYLLGNEMNGIPQKFMEGKIVVQIPTSICLNVASAGTVVMYDRIAKQQT